MEEASLSFHPTLDSRGKEYHYFLCNSPVQLPFDHAFSWHFPSSLNLDKMRKGAALLLGQHDFSAFCNDHALSCKNALCHLSYFEIHPLQGDRFCFILRGDRFLYKMVRNLVGTLVYVGCGKLEVDYLPTLLEKKKRALGGVTAPAHGLLLKRVFYADEK
jgi:tRNA pseudouridine38-40 synthase